MIPIIFDNTERDFTSNGLGRLRDCISCVVTEERNGIYECDFEYPLDGANFGLIQIGRIIGITHDDTGDIQPFDIVSYTRPIDGTVTFHCVHISYRLSGQTVVPTSINSLAAAFALLGNVSGTPFTYQTNKTNTGYLASADGIPKTVRSMLGGVEGSILDTYGGEYEWDRWTVILHSARGQYRNFSIRYGVNMLEYQEEYDSTGTYSSCIPYWTDGADIIVGDRQSSGLTTITGRDDCVPLDVSDKFESKPTKAQVNSMGLSQMSTKNPTIPAQNIHVEFVRLQDMGYEGLDDLLTCRLCDTINVVFPDYNSSGVFKIVKTVWDALQGRYESMELGDLSTTLTEALGLNDNANSWSSKTGTLKYASLSTDKAVQNNTNTELCNITLDAGKWVVVAGIRWATNTAGYRKLNIMGGSAASDLQMTSAPISGNYTQMVFTRIIEVATNGTTYYLNGMQTSGSQLNALAGGNNWGTYITAVRII